METRTLQHTDLAPPLGDVKGLLASGREGSSISELNRPTSLVPMLPESITVMVNPPLPELVAMRRSPC